MVRARADFSGGGNGPLPVAVAARKAGAPMSHQSGPVDIALRNASLATSVSAETACGLNTEGSKRPILAALASLICLPPNLRFLRREVYHSVNFAGHSVICWDALADRSVMLGSSGDQALVVHRGVIQVLAHRISGIADLDFLDIARLSEARRQTRIDSRPVARQAELFEPCAHLIAQRRVEVRAVFIHQGLDRGVVALGF